MIIGEKCQACGLVATERAGGYGREDQAVDPCFGVLPDVIHSCCGHGGESLPYVIVSPGASPGTDVRLLEDYAHFEGDYALEWMRLEAKLRDARR